VEKRKIANVAPIVVKMFMTNSFTKNINGLILAGGQSSRMGADKGILDFHGKPQRKYLHDLLAKFCNQVFLSCRADQNIPADLNPIPDSFAFKSPLNGILSAFKYNANVAWLSLPIDMPFVDDKVIAYLLEHRDKHKIATCFYDSDGKHPEPLLALWEPQAYPLLMSFYKEGKISPRDFLLSHQTHIVRPPNADLHFNINTPEDLARFKTRKDHSS
jgi:molybdenum cofactor guanylyltransferase